MQKALEKRKHIYHFDILRFELDDFKRLRV